MLSDKQINECETVSQQEMETILPNLVDLESFSEGIILHQCGKRYTSGKIYTFVGTILVAVNPFKRLDIYGPSVIEKFRQSSTSSEAMEPHVFAISSLALQHLKSDKMSQSVLISGE